MPRKSSLPRTPNAVVIIRGRAESGVFTCPNCQKLLSFRFRGGYRHRCPGCRRVWMVGLVIREATGRGPIRSRRPPDSILPPTKPEETEPLPPEEPVDPLPRIALVPWDNGTPIHVRQITPFSDASSDASSDE